MKEACSKYLSPEELYNAANNGGVGAQLNIIKTAQRTADRQGDEASSQAFQIFYDALSKAYYIDGLIQRGDNIIKGHKPHALSVAKYLCDEKIYWGSSKNSILAEFTRRCGKQGKCIVVDRVRKHLKACSDVIDATPKSIKKAMLDQQQDYYAEITQPQGRTTLLSL